MKNKDITISFIFFDCKAKNRVIESTGLLIVPRSKTTEQRIKIIEDNIELKLKKFNKDIEEGNVRDSDGYHDYDEDELKEAEGEYMLRGRILVSIRENKGGCHKDPSKLKEKGNMVLISGKRVENHGNCFFTACQVVNQEVKNTYAKYRSLLNIEKTGNLSVSDGRIILNYFKMDEFKMVDILCNNLETGENMKEKMKEVEAKYLVLLENHWFVFKSFRNESGICEICKTELNGKHTESGCKRNLKREDFNLNQKRIACNKIYVDMESRPDLDDYSLKGEYRFYSQKGTLLCLYFENKKELPISVTQHQNFIIHEDRACMSFLGEDCIVKFVDFLQQQTEEQRYYNVYAHNGGRFDYFLMMGEILKSHHRDYFFNECVIPKGTKILKFQMYSHFFFDTYNFLGFSLDKLCEDFKLEQKLCKAKVIDGYDTMNDICLYKRDELTPKEFLEYLDSDDAEAKRKKEIYIEYCLLDCIALGEVHKKLCDSIVDMMELITDEFYNDQNKLNKFKIYKFTELEFAESLTLPSFVNNIFKIMNLETDGKKYKSGIKILEGAVRAFFEKTITGGISHVGKEGKYEYCKLGTIDIVSLYPAQMIQQQYPYGEPIATNKYVEGKIGAYRVININQKVKCIGDIPKKVENGLDWSTQYIEEAYIWHTDIIRMKEHGCEMEIQEGYYWEETHNPYLFLQIVVNIKMEQDRLKDAELPYNVSLRQVAKLMANSLYGKQIERSTKDHLTFFKSPGEIYPELFDNENNTLYFSNNCFVLREKEANTTSPLQYGSLILAYSRDSIQRNFDIIGRDNVIFTETDSICCPVSCIEKYADLGNTEGNFRLSKDLGCMTADYGIDDYISSAYVLNKKCYRFNKIHHKEDVYDKTFKEEFKKDDIKLDDGIFKKTGMRVPEIKSRMAGVPNKYLTEEHYETLFQNETVSFEKIQLFTRHLINGSETGIRIGFMNKTIKKQPSLEYEYYTNII
jgi:hypothetical protein